ncbi:hypothetical protein ACFW88_27325 [Streptomyces anandii]|uniref:Integral membrane protein n=1 Tax=Streptomyces anandii TaxID=285454 RepID=A0ABW6HC42_9ACTN
MRTPRPFARRTGTRPHGRQTPAGRGSARNPLERPSDRLERRLRVLLAAMAVAVLPLLAWSAGGAVHDHYARQRQTQLARLHPVEARLLTDARSAGDRPGAQRGFQALVRWSDRQGGHTGVAPVRAWLERGATTTVWLDGHGVPAAPPVTGDLANTAGMAVGFATACGGAVVAYGVWRAVAGGIDRGRLGRWTREWESVEPGWTARYGR